MNPKAILHIPESPFACPLGDGRFLVRLRVDASERGLEAYVHYGAKYPFTKKRHKAKMRLAYLDSEFAYLEATLRLDDPRLAYVFELRQNGERRYYSEKGLVERYDFSVSYRDFFQFPYVWGTDKSPSWVDDAVFYQIFPDRFRIGKGDLKKDYINLRWGDAPNPKSFAGGDLKGIIESLPYLRKLGINAIYLTPIFLSPSNHKYDTVDYLRIDPQFGSEDDLKELIALAHGLNMRIVLDAVFNHVSRDSVYFLDAIKNGKGSQYWDWFFVKGDAIDLDSPNYEYFSVCPYMPKLNAASPSCSRFLLKVCLHYLELGIDGWRLDVADEVSHAFWAMLSSNIKRLYPDSILVAEHWHNPNRFLEDGLDGAMNYPVTYAIEDFIAKKEIDAFSFASRINRIYANLYPTKLKGMLNLLESHDTFRFLTLCQGDEDRYRQALAILFFLPGMSCLYYGAEVPLEGGYDPDCRRCFPSSSFKRKSSQFDFLRKLIRIRKLKALSEDGFRCYEKGGLLFIERGSGAKAIQLAVNATDSPRECPPSCLLGNKHQNGKLLPNGFIIRRINK